MFLQHFRTNVNNENDQCNYLYLSIINYIKIFYKNNKTIIKKDFSTSFELSTLLIFVIFYSYKGKLYYTYKKTLIEIFVKDLDHSFRLLGIGDMSIGKYVKKYLKKAYYRFDQLDKIFKKNNYSEFEKYIMKKSIINLNENNNNISKILFDYLRKSIKVTKTTKLSNFIFK